MHTCIKYAAAKRGVSNKRNFPKDMRSAESRYKDEERGAHFLTSVEFLYNQLIEKAQEPS